MKAHFRMASFLIVLAARGVAAQEATAHVGVAVDQKKLISQHLYPKNNACVPAAYLNTLRCGAPAMQKAFARLPGKNDKDKLLHIIDKYGGRPSSVEKTPYFHDEGVWAEDIPLFFNAILDDHGGGSVAGMYFDRTKGETWFNQVRRVHRHLVHSLSAGIPVLISVRSFAAVDAPKAKEKFLWEGLVAHAIVITRVPAKLEPHQKGFSFDFIDPDEPALREGYLFADERGFQATKGTKSKIHWVENGFLHINAPSLNLTTRNQPWYARTFMTLCHGTGKFDVKR